MSSAYSRDQLISYLDYIGLPKDLHKAPPTLDLLKQLHTYTISKLPYENLSLHYNPSHSIDLDPQQLFTKIVTNNRGRGGFCMEIALLYNHVLRALGFDAYTAGVRTRPRTHVAFQAFSCIFILHTDLQSYHASTKRPNKCLLDRDSGRIQCNSSGSALSCSRAASHPGFVNLQTLSERQRCYA